MSEQQELVSTSLLQERLRPYSFVIIAFGLFGNVNIIIATTRHERLQMKCGVLIGVLAVVDSLCLLCELSLTIRPLFLGHATTQFHCFFFSLPYLVLYPMEVFLVLCLAIDRLLAIDLPLQYSSWTTKKYIRVIIFYGLMMGVLNVLINSVFHHIEGNQLLNACSLTISLPDFIFAFWNYAIAVSGILTTVIYNRAVRHIKQYARQRAILKTRESDRITYQGLKAQRQTIRTMAVNVHLNVLLTVSTLIAVNVCRLFDGGSEWMTSIQLAGTIPMQLSYSINFYVFLWRSRKYRKIFTDQLHCRHPAISQIGPVSNGISVVDRPGLY